MPDIIQQIRDTYAENPAAALKLLPELFKQYDEGGIVEINEKLALAMGAGARAISQNRQGQYGMTYVWDIFGKGKEIPYCVAATELEKVAERALKENESK